MERRKTFVIIDNAANIHRRDSKRNSEFYDDCGIWQTDKGSTPVSYYIVEEETGMLRYLVKKNGIYCVQKTVAKEKMYVPLEPQPCPSDILALHRSYSTLKLSGQYKRRVSRVSTFPSSMTQEPPKSVALVEYVRKHPCRVHESWQCQSSIRIYTYSWGNDPKN